MAIAKDTARTLPEMEPPERRIVRLTIPARAEYITLCRLALTGLARLRPISEELVADLKLALTEATSNSVRHAYGEREGTVEIAYELRGDRLVIEVNDDGEGFDHEEDGDVGDLENLTEGGLGIAIIRSIADEFVLTRGPGGRGSRLRFAKVLTASPACCNSSTSGPSSSATTPRSRRAASWTTSALSPSRSRGSASCTSPPPHS